MVTSHTTSKIADFSDLRALATYGFRGEALNALCGLSEVEIETKRRTDSVGRKFTFDASGGVKTSAPLAMNPGKGRPFELVLLFRVIFHFNFQFFIFIFQSLNGWYKTTLW